MTNPRTEGRYLTDESYVLERAPVQHKLRYPEELLAERVKELEAALRLIIENEDSDTGYGNSSAKIARAALGDKQ